MASRLPLSRPLILTFGLLVSWQAIVSLAKVPPFIVPQPLAVITTLVSRYELILEHALITAIEIILGFAFGLILGITSALLLVTYDFARKWLLPIFVVTQALPVFALAPLLVLWLGYGMASKVTMAVLIVYFPITANLYDGLRRTDPEILHLSRLCGASAWDVLFRIRLPSALPSLTSGMRVAASIAPIGAIVGEWVGSSKGLGFLMLHANARMQIDLMFAALFVLAVMALLLFGGVTWLSKQLVPWQSDTVLEKGI